MQTSKTADRTMTDERDKTPFAKGKTYTGFGFSYGTITKCKYYPEEKEEKNFALVFFNRPKGLNARAFQWDVDHWNEVDYSNAISTIYSQYGL